MINELSIYFKAFKKLRIDRSHGGIAPHKPILLVSVLQAVQIGLITSNKIYLTAELIGLFRSNWNALVRTHHDCRISYPFYYMKSERFWKLIAKEGLLDISKLDTLVKNINRLNAVVDYALIDDPLFELMADKEANQILLHFLLAEYFPEFGKKLVTPNNQLLFQEIENKILHETGSDYKRVIKKLIDDKRDEEIFLRGSVFKREIPKIYNYTCCISGMRIDASVNVSMIDACHIVPFSESYNDTITNGIALCPNLHRAFDRGLIGIDENYTAVISKTFKEDETNYSIRAFSGKEIQLPFEKKYYPLIDNFRWHRNNVFK